MDRITIPRNLVTGGKKKDKGIREQVFGPFTLHVRPRVLPSLLGM